MADQCPTFPTAYPSDCELLEGYRSRGRKRESRTGDVQRKIALEKARDIQLLLLDVDGVLTDGTLLYCGNGEEGKSFNTQDGFGLRLLMEAGIEVGVITARQSEVVARRAGELKMRHIYQGVGNKNEAFKEVMRVTRLKPYQIAYMGDDWLDLVLLQQVGLALVPANGAREVKEIAHFITERCGGAGAVRDACDLLIEGKNLLMELLQKYKNR